MRYLVFVCLAFLLLSNDTKKITPEEYIAFYKKIAIDEMHRSGVPASITLAQGYLESGCGNSTLAVKANNHFGIKCHTEWKGDTFFIEDDDYDENGELKKSCFRVYKNAQESFVDHSEFLTGRSRYAFLFELRTTDYKGWANGLKKAGYATNPKYADLLINIIERYELYQYDVEKEQKLLASPRLNSTEVFNINEIPAIAYDGVMTLRQLRDKYFTAEWQIFKYNDFDRKTPLKKGMIIYLKPKRSQRNLANVHTVQEGENMQFISQLRGIKLKKLHKLNNLAYSEEPAVGETLNLKEKRADKPKTSNSKTPYKYFSLENESELFNLVSKDVPADAEAPVANKSEIEKPDGIYHKVATGETLMSIARAYNKDWKEIKAQNGLTTDNLEVGALLLIEPRQEGAISTKTEEIEDSTIIEVEKEEPVVKEEEKTTENTPSTANVAGFHKVQKGETLFSISRLYGFTVAELMELNKLSSPSVSEGASIRIKK